MRISWTRPTLLSFSGRIENLAYLRIVFRRRTLAVTVTYYPKVTTGGSTGPVLPQSWLLFRDVFEEGSFEERLCVASGVLKRFRLDKALIEVMSKTPVQERHQVLGLREILEGKAGDVDVNVFDQVDINVKMTVGHLLIPLNVYGLTHPQAFQTYPKVVSNELLYVILKRLGCVKEKSAVIWMPYLSKHVIFDLSPLRGSLVSRLDLLTSEELIDGY